eukprot:gene3790-6951_t
MLYYYNYLYDKDIQDINNLEKNKIPIVYRDEYNIRLLGLEKLHPFDTEKFKNIYKRLIKIPGITPKSFFVPKKITKKKLLNIHTKEYLNSLEKKENIISIVELGALNYLPTFFLIRNLIDPIKYASQGTIMSGELALHYGWSINLGGGYHHAYSEQGGGWCFFDDIMISIDNLFKLKKIQKAMIIDLDAHQGNGIERDKLIHPRKKDIFIFDMFNYYNYPRDIYATSGINIQIDLKPFTKDEIYLKKLKNGLTESFKLFKPDIIFFNGGSDILENDPLGRLSISSEGLIKRDEMVFEFSKRYKIPISFVLSGGYQKTNAEIIFNSITNLKKKFNLF